MAGNRKPPSVALIVREPAAEPLRMAVGLTTLFDDITVIVADHKLSPEVASGEHMEALMLMGVRVLTNFHQPPLEYVSDAEMAAILVSCDKVIAY